MHENLNINKRKLLCLFFIISLASIIIINIGNTYAAPDLIINNSDAPSSGQRGENLEINYNIKNNASDDIPSDESWSNEIVLSNDEKFDYSDTFLDSEDMGGPLNAGNSKAGKFSITLPDYYGNFYLILRTDQYNGISESDETNNDLAIPILIKYPDLTITNTNTPNNASRGESISFQYTVKNNGTGNILGDIWEDELYLSKDENIDIDDVYLTDKSVSGPLNSGMTYTKTMSAQIPDNTMPGNYYLILITEHQNYIDESDETNNDLAIPILIKYPDLIINNTNAPNNASPGQSITFNFTVKNNGTGNIVGDVWEDKIFLSLDSILDPTGDECIFSEDMNLELDNGQTYTKTLTTQIPEYIAPGTYYIIIKTDETDYVEESNENNNILIIPFIVNGPDLIITNINAPTSAILGNTITLTYTVKNNGNGDIGGDTWDDVVYLSKDQFLSSEEEWSSYKSINGPLISGQTYTQTMTLEIPEGLVPGTYYLILKVDEMGYLEDNENNNILTVPLTLYKPVIRDTKPPRITATYPKNKSKNFSRSALIGFKFSENIFKGSNWSKIVVKNKHGKKVAIRKWIVKNVLVIKTKQKMSKNSYYKVYIPAGAIKDKSRNNLSTKYTLIFKTGRR